MPREDAGYPPIGDYGLIGDCHSAALVSRAGSIDWCCLPRFDAGSTFGRLLDHDRGGHCSIEPTERGSWEHAREYLEDSLVLSTTIKGPGGEVRLLDCFTMRDNADPGPQILRLIEGRRGNVELTVRVAPRFDYGEVRPWIVNEESARLEVRGSDELCRRRGSWSRRPRTTPMPLPLRQEFLRDRYHRDWDHHNDVRNNVVLRRKRSTSRPRRSSPISSSATETCWPSVADLSKDGAASLM